MSNLRFPDTLAGLEISVQREADYDVKVQTSQSRKELRWTPETYPLTRYKVGFEVLRSDSSLSTRARELQQALTHIARHYGQLDSFLLVDPADSSVTDHGFAVGDGATTAFQLQRTLQGQYIDSLGTYAQVTKPRTNYIIRSQQFDDASWSKNTGVTVQADTAIAPDGTPTADRITYDGSGVSGSFRIWQQTLLGSNLIPGKSYTNAIWLRADVPVTLRLSDNWGDFVTCSVTTAWQRFALTASPTSQASHWQLILYSNAADNATFQVYAWGGQSEIAAAASQYIPTTSATVAINPALWPSYADGFEPIFDINYLASPFAIYADGDWRLRRQIYPFARTNLMLWSEQIDNAAWVKSGATVTANTTTAPDGTATADKLVESAANVDHYAAQAVTLSAGFRYVKSVYAKASGRNFCILQMKTLDGSFRSATFDLVNGTVSPNSVDGSGIQPLANGWFRCWIAVDARTGVNAANEAILLSNTSGFGTPYLGDGASGVYLWGAQTEVVAGNATAPTEYIQTTTVAVSRTDYTLSATASVTPVAVPAAGTFYSWDGNFYRRVRFAQQAVSVEQMVQTMWAAKSLQLQSVKP